MAKSINGSVVYQVYPRSFQDSNNDGIGDIKGIIRRLDYLHGLGVDYVWMNPVYASPMNDFGYDISDYLMIDPMFGTLADVDALIAEARKRGIGIIMDLVPNHTSDQHEWFKASAASRDSVKSDWYIWKDANSDGGVPNNWISRFGGSAWEWHEGRKQYYLHSFLKEQPDLNWENPAVRQAFANVMRFWLQRGIDGFRVDAIDLMGKDFRFLDEPDNPDYDPTVNIEYERLRHIYTRDAGNFFDHLRFIADVAAEFDNKLIMFESWFYERAKPSLYHDFYRSLNRDRCLPFNFELIFMDWDAAKLQAFLDGFQQGLRDGDVPAYMLGNHDVQRFASKVGEHNARLGAVLLLTLPGISLIYNGDEIGMSNANLPASVQTDPDGRDPFRTPMQWNGLPHGSFTRGKPWLPVAANYGHVNVEVQEKDGHSMLSVYKTLIALRKKYACLREGSYKPGPALNGGISYYRKGADGGECLVLINMSDVKQVVPVGAGWRQSIVISPRSLSNANCSISNNLEISPCTAIILLHSA